MTLSRPTSLDLSSDPAGAAAAVLGPAGATPSNPAGPRSQVDVLAGLSEDQLLLLHRATTQLCHPVTPT